MQKVLTNTLPLKSLKKAFNNFLRSNISCFGTQNTLRDACEFALLNGGKRIRPLIVMIIAQVLDNKLNVLEPSLSVEFFHTATLIIDDLPCMDNENFRRSKPALHKVFGESVALLASQALVSAGYEKIFQSVRILSQQGAPFGEQAKNICMVAFDTATRGTGISGAVGGQYKDLFSTDRSLEAVLDMIYKKTITLFEVSFVFGWIFGGGDLSQVCEMRDIAFHFGMAFQIADDLRDMKKDGNDSLNIGFIFGKDRAYARFTEEIEFFIQKLKKIGLMSSAFQQIINVLISYVKAGS